MLIFFAMLHLPIRQQIGPVSQAAHYAIDVLLSYGLQNDTSKLVLQELNPGTGLDSMFSSKLRRNYKLALGRECGTQLCMAYVIL